MIMELLSAKGIEVASDDHRHTREGWLNLDCPFCGTFGKFHLGYNLRFKYFNCWHCGHHSNVKVLCALLKVSTAEAKKLLAEHSADVESYEFKKTEVAGVVKEPSRIDDLQSIHKKYLRNRKFNAAEIATRWGVKGIGIHHKHAWCLWIPIHYRGELVSWTTRSLNPDADMKYITAKKEEEKIHHKDILYGLDFANSAIVVVEGPFDAWRIGPGACATLGTAYTTSQVVHISKFPVRAVCYDKAASAQRAANKLCDELSTFPGETYNIEIDSDDPGEATRKEVKHIRKHVLGL